MIGVLFEFSGEIIEVRVEGTNTMFRTQQYGGQFAPIEGLHLDYAGVCREFPDLETNKEWRKIAIERFKEKIKTMKDEEERMEYIMNDLKKYGYVPRYYQKQGFRPRKLE